jgi:hypothetical protein
MPKLSDTQLVILNAACQRETLALPLPKSRKAGLRQLVKSLIAKGLLEEVDTKLGEPVWRETVTATALLGVTDAAFRAWHRDRAEMSDTAEPQRRRR